MEDRVKIGLIGLGSHMYDNLIQRLMGLPVEISAVSDVKPERIALFQQRYHIPRSYTDFRKMLEKEDLTAVICAANPDVHYEAAKLGMESGCYVFIEKSPCTTAEQAQQLAEIQRKTNRYTAVGFNRRFASAYTMAKEITGRPEFGSVSMYQAKYHASPYESQEIYVSNHIINHLDLARFLLGEIEIRHVERFKRDDRRGGYNLTFTAENGTIGNLQSASVLHITYPMERVELVGDGRNVIVDNVKNIEYNRPGKAGGGWEHASLSDESDALFWNLNQGQHSPFTYLGFDLELKDFIASVMQRRAPLYHMDDTVKTMKLLNELQSLLAL